MTSLFQKLISWMLLMPTLLASYTPAPLEEPTLTSADLLTEVSVVETAKPDVPAELPATADFAVKLLQNTMEDGENALVSPLSVLSALSMTANGAAGDTLTEMETALGAPIADYNAYLRAYAANVPHDEGCDLHLANALWLRDDPELTVREDFLETVKQNYDAGIYTAPFDGTTVDDINSFVNYHTKERIQKIIDKLPDAAMLCLVNALSFDGAWADIYKETSVQDATFTTETGEKRDVELMYSTEWDFLEDDQATGFLKPYEGGDFAFLALLPNEGVSVADYLDGLSGERLSALLSSPQHIKTYAAIPQFKAEFSTSLKEALQNMGMPLAFEEFKANFSNMGEYQPKNDMVGNLYIGDVLHKTFLQVDEQGTQAGAATAVIMYGATSALMPPEETREVYLDRPFVYGIVDLRTNLPVFLGVQMDIT